MRFLRLIFALFTVLAVTRSARAVSSSVDAAHLHVQLTTMADFLHRPGSNRAGLYFKLEPGWHIYWENPGDSGEPPHIHWTLPDGITAGPLQFPPPSQLPLGPLMDFGYAGEVIFPLDLNVAGTAAIGPAVLRAKVDWLVCREVCIPGKAELELDREVKDDPLGGLQQAPPDSALWRAFKLPPDTLPAKDTAVFQPTPTGFRLAVSTGQRETQAAFFPEDENILDNPAPQTVTPLKSGLVLDLKKGPNLTANPTQLRGVLRALRRPEL